MNVCARTFWHGCGTASLLSLFVPLGPEAARSQPTSRPALYEFGEDGYSTADLHEADANDDLRQPIRYLFKVGIALVPFPSRLIGGPHRAWDSEQQANCPAC